MGNSCAATHHGAIKEPCLSTEKIRLNRLAAIDHKTSLPPFVAIDPFSRYASHLPTKPDVTSTAIGYFSKTTLVQAKEDNDNHKKSFLAPPRGSHARTSDRYDIQHTTNMRCTVCRRCSHKSVAARSLARHVSSPMLLSMTKNWFVSNSPKKPACLVA